MRVDDTWVPAWSDKREPCPWRPNHAMRCWERPHGLGVVRVVFELGLCPHDCEALLGIAREGCADVRLEHGGAFSAIVIRAGSAIAAWLQSHTLPLQTPHT